MSIELKERPGRKAWYMEGTEFGVLVRESTGTADRGKAEEILAAKRAEIFKRHTHGEQATCAFVKAATEYMEDHPSARRFLDRLLFDTSIEEVTGEEVRTPTDFSAMLLRDIKQRTLDDLKKKMFPGGAKNATLVRALFGPVRSVLRWAAKRELCAVPAFDVPKTGKGRTRRIEPADAEQLIAACPEHFRPLATFLIGTGCRLSEALYLDWSKVSLDGGYVIIDGGTDDEDDDINTKNGEERTVPLSPRVLAALRTLPHRDGAVFRARDGKPYARDDEGRNGGGARKTLARAAERAGLSHVHPHICRHTFATWHCQMGTHQFRLMLLGGWSSVGMVKRYSHMQGLLSDADRAIIAPWLCGLEAHQVQALRPRLVVGE